MAFKLKIAAYVEEENNSLAVHVDTEQVRKCSESYKRCP
jgi:hypothetical protein